MLHRSLILLVLALCGCASGTLSVVDNYHWSSASFVVKCPYGSWTRTKTLTANGQHHIYYGRQKIFGISNHEGLASSCYKPIGVPSPPISLLQTFSNVTNWMGHGATLEVEVLRQDEGSMLYQWDTGITIGIEKLVALNSEVYRLQYWRSPISQSRKREKAWLSAVKEATLTEQQAN